MMPNSASRLLILAIVCLGQLCLASPGAAEVVDRIVAQVNDEIITMSELEAMTKSIEVASGLKPTPKEDQALRRQMLESLIDQKLAKAEAKKRGINVSDKEVDQALADFKKRNNIPNDEALNQALSQAGLTMKELRQRLSDQIQQERIVAVMVQSKVTIPEAEIRRYYDESAKEGGGRNQAHLRVIQLPFPQGGTQAQRDEVRAKAEALLKDVQQGVPFAEAARKQGAPETDMGFVSLNDLNPQLVEHLNRLKPKEVVPIQTAQGFQMVQLLERRSGPVRTYEEMAPEIRRALMRKEMEKYFSDWVKTLREKAHIKIML
jgi:peptidyl-prolyl cis-trans isomerase SurA